MKLNRIFILGACSVAFLSSCACSNNNDQKVLDEVNKILRDNASSINTCYDAIKKVEEKKIELNEHKFSRENYEFVYDSKAKQFVIMDGDNIVRTSSGYTRSVNTLDYFKSVYVYNPNSKYSQYLDKRAEVPEQLLITTGFDIGDHIDIPNIAYTNLSNNPHDVIVRTYSDYFSVLAPLDTVHHYEIATNVIVTDIATLDMHASTAYVNAKNGYINFAADSSTDFFEKDQEAKKVEIDIEDGAEFYAAVNIKKTKSGDDIDVVLPSASVTSVAELEQAITEGKIFIRLANDITYSESMDLKDQSICLDLAGYKITFENDNSKNYTAISVKSGKSLYILDSQGVLDNNSGIDLHDCYISIHSTAEKSPATLMINGGKITQTVTPGHEYSAAVQCIGNTKVDSEDSYESNFIMYGGKIEARMSNDSLDSTCVTSYGKGANVNIVYGTLISDAGCIACNPGKTEYSLGGSTLSINGGHFTAGLKIKATCIEYGESIDLSINGGTFTGDTCLTLKSGTAKVTNATFNALGQYRPQYFGVDGSAINIYNNDKIKLELEITDSFIYSNFAYVLSAQEGVVADVTFNNGLYSYYLDGVVNIPEESAVSITIVNPDNFIQHAL